MRTTALVAAAQQEVVTFWCIIHVTLLRNSGPRPDSSHLLVLLECSMPNDVPCSNSVWQLLDLTVSQYLSFSDYSLGTIFRHYHICCWIIPLYNVTWIGVIVNEWINVISVSMLFSLCLFEHCRKLFDLSWSYNCSRIIWLALFTIYTNGNGCKDSYYVILLLCLCVR